MQKFILATLALVFAGSVANASTVPARRNIRLQLTERSFAAGGSNPSTVVYGNGQVVTQTCRAIFPKPCNVDKIQHLSAREMDRVERLIDRARHGKATTPKPGIHCMAMPFQNVSFYADNGSVFLFSEDRPCGVPTYNNSPAASKLVQLLEKLHDRAFMHDAATSEEDLSLDLDE